MAVALPTVTMVHPSGQITKTVFVGRDVTELAAEGWTYQGGSAPTFTLRPPVDPPKKCQVNGRTYEAIDETIETRKNSTITSGAYDDIEGLLMAGWTLV